LGWIILREKISNVGRGLSFCDLTYSSSLNLPTMKLFISHS